MNRESRMNDLRAEIEFSATDVSIEETIIVEEGAPLPPDRPTIPLVVALWENKGYHGRKRLLVEDTPNLSLLNFDNTAQAIGVHPGPDYDAWKQAHGGEEPVVVFYQDSDYRGYGLILQTSAWPSIDAPILAYHDQVDFNFNGQISSVRFNPPLRDGMDAALPSLGFIDESDGEHTGNIGDPDNDDISPTDAAPIGPIPVIVELYQDIWYGGNRLVIVENSTNLVNDFGPEFGGPGAPSSAVVHKGPDFQDGDTALLVASNTSGVAPLVLNVGSVGDFTQNGFNDLTVSVIIHP